MSAEPGVLVKPHGWIGDAVDRKEDPRLLSGEATFLADLIDGTELHAYIIRSWFAPHARIESIDVAAARELPGVFAVLTSADLPQPVPVIPLRLWPLPGVERALQPVLATDRVRYIGEPVAVILAASRYVAEDAAELISVDYADLGPVIGMEFATSRAAPELHQGVSNNIVGTVGVKIGDVEQATRLAVLSVSGDFHVNRHSGVPLETRGLIAQPEGAGVRVWGPTKVSHFNRKTLSALLKVPEGEIHFIEPSVGGGFGVRGEFYPEDYLIPFLAMRTGRRVSWVEDRSESLLATNHSREQDHSAELCVDSTNRIVSIKTHGRNSQGAYVRTHGATVATMTAIMMPGPYRITNFTCDIDCVLENKSPTGTYRGPGRFEGNFVRERLVDMAARKLEIDPAKFRMQNFLRPEDMPYDFGIDIRMGDLHVHQRYDSGDYARQLSLVLDKVDYPALKAARDAAQLDGSCVGIGIASFVEKSGIGRWEYARVEVTAAGTIMVFTGLESVGQGVETAMAQIAAQAIGVSIDLVSVLHGDTDQVPLGMGSFASRGTTMGGGAVYSAALKVRDELLAAAAAWLDEDLSTLRIEEDCVRGAATKVSFAQLFAAAGTREVFGAGTRTSLSAEAIYESEDLSYPYGTNLAVVEIDVETGQLQILRYVLAYDVGVAVNPKLVHGQIVGGFAQGLGGALLEEFRYGNDGQPAFASFQEYLLPTAMDIPDVEVILTEDSPSPVHPLGLKGAGEGGTVAVAPTLANAVSDALGVEVFDLPLSRHAILELVRRSKWARR